MFLERPSLYPCRDLVHSRWPALRVPPIPDPHPPGVKALQGGSYNDGFRILFCSFSEITVSGKHIVSKNLDKKPISFHCFYDNHIKNKEQFDFAIKNSVTLNHFNYNKPPSNTHPVVPNIGLSSYSPLLRHRENPASFLRKIGRGMNLLQVNRH